jgi:hypothetical protein
MRMRHGRNVGVHLVLPRVVSDHRGGRRARSVGGTAALLEVGERMSLATGPSGGDFPPATVTVA